MKTLTDIRLALKRNLPILAGLCLCLYFSYHIVTGERSYSELSRLNTMAHLKEAQLNQLHSEKQALEKKVGMMRSESASADMMEEQMRYILGYKRQGEVLLLGN